MTPLESSGGDHWKVADVSVISVTIRCCGGVDSGIEEREVKIIIRGLKMYAVEPSNQDIRGHLWTSVVRKSVS